MAKNPKTKGIQTLRARLQGHNRSITSVVTSLSFNPEAQFTTISAIQHNWQRNLRTQAQGTEAQADRLIVPFATGWHNGITRQQPREVILAGWATPQPLAHGGFDNFAWVVGQVIDSIEQVRIETNRKLNFFAFRAGAGGAIAHGGGFHVFLGGLDKANGQTRHGGGIASSIAD